MNINKSLRLTSRFVSNSIKEGAILIQDMLNMSLQFDRIELNKLKFLSGKPFDLKQIQTLKDIVDYKIPILDLLFYLNLSEVDRSLVKWEISDILADFTEGDACNALMIVYLMVLCRNKNLPNESEPFPSLIIKGMGNNMLSRERITEILTVNDINQFDNQWVMDVDLKSFSTPVKNRLRQGVAGHRLLNIFKNYKPEVEVPANLKFIYEKLVEVAESGPYWDLHSRFQPKQLTSIPINANLSNLITLIYTDDEIKNMVRNKSLYSKPQFEGRAQQFMTWTESFFELFQRKLIFE